MTSFVQFDSALALQKGMGEAGYDLEKVCYFEEGRPVTALASGLPLYPDQSSHHASLEQLTKLADIPDAMALGFKNRIDGPWIGIGVYKDHQEKWVMGEALARQLGLLGEPSKIEEQPVNTDSAVKLDDGKPAMSLLPMDALQEVAKCLAFGAEKYGPYNWRKGFDWSRLEAALLRHYAAYQTGEDRDKESGHLHTAHMAVNALFLLAHQLNGYGKDDRYEPEATKDS